MSLWGLFASGFLSSTLLPGGSEVALLYLARTGETPSLTLLAVATLGNTLGGLTSWLLGWWLARRWPGEALVKPSQRRALAWLHRHGSPILLLSWLPVVGDPLCLAAGWLRVGLPAATLFIAAGKAGRYGVLLWVAG